MNDKNNTHRKVVQNQFGRSAADYATSKVHALGGSLVRLLDTIEPGPEWLVLDVATAAGHTAHTFSPYVYHVVAMDITIEMLAVAADQAKEKDLTNVSRAQSDAERLPFAGELFDLVTCRIAPHHFPDVATFISESVRVLRPGGLLAVSDNIVPGSQLPGKKGQRQRDIGRYINSFDRLRDPSHVRCFSLDEWQAYFYQAGLRIIHQEKIEKRLDFDEWSQRTNVSTDDEVRLRVMLRQAPEGVLSFLKPSFRGRRISFQMTEGILIGEKGNGRKSL